MANFITKLLRLDSATEVNDAPQSLGMQVSKEQLLKVVRQDGWENIFTGLNQSNRDKTTGMTPVPINISPDMADAIYAASDMAARIVDMVPDEMTREGFDVCIQGNKALTEKVEQRFRDINFLQKWNEGYKIARKQGGAGIFLGVQEKNKNTNLTKPLDLKNVERIDYMTVFEAQELRPVEWQGNPFAADFGMPLMYEVSPRAQGLSYNNIMFKRVHASRFIRLEGTKFSRTEKGLPIPGWPRSIYDRIFPVIRQFESVWGSVTAVMEDVCQAVFKIHGLADAIASDKEGYIHRRYAAIDMFRSSRKAILLDAEKESFERTNSQLAGVADIIEQTDLRLASAAKTPAALLMGQSPSGLNSTGASEIRWWFDQIASMQKLELVPVIEMVCKMIFNELGTTPANWSVKCRSLWQPSDKEVADVRQQIAQADSQYVAMGALSPDEIAKSRFGGDAFSLETHINMGDEVSGETEVETEYEAPEGGEAPVVSGGEAQMQDLRPEVNPEYFDKINLIITQVASKQVAREAGLAMLEKFFRIDPEDAEELLGPEDAELVVGMPDPAAGPSAPAAESDKPVNAAQEDKAIASAQGKED